MTGVSGVGGLIFRAPVMILAGTGFAARSVVEEASKIEGDEDLDVASDVCPPRRVEGALWSRKPELKPDSVPRPSQASFVKALKRAADASSSRCGLEGYS